MALALGFGAALAAPRPRTAPRPRALAPRPPARPTLGAMVANESAQHELAPAQRAPKPSWAEMATEDDGWMLDGRLMDAGWMRDGYRIDGGWMFLTHLARGIDTNVIT